MSGMQVIEGVPAARRGRRLAVVSRYTAGAGVVLAVAGGSLYLASWRPGAVLAGGGLLVALASGLALFAVAVSTGLDICDDHGDHATIDRFRRPDGLRYDRCRHAPPHC